MTWLFLASAVASGCGAADSDVDPGDLELRDLLGVAPEVAASWDRAGRARAREVIARAARAEGEDAGEVARLEQGADRRASIVAGMRIVDEQRRARDREPVVLAWVLAEDQQLEVVPVAGEVMDLGGHAGPPGLASGPSTDPFGDPFGDPSALVFEGWDGAASAGWADLTLRQPGLLSALARQAGHGDEPRPLPVIPAPQAPFAMIVVDAGPRSFAAVNPVLLAAQEPPDGDDDGDDDGDGEAVAHAGSGASSPAARLRSRDASRAPRPRDPGIVSSPPIAFASAGNPYSFYGSINECAEFQRQRCEDCTAAGACETVTREGESGLAECQALSAGGDRGHYLFCINLALAIATVSDCTSDAAAQCPQAPAAGNQLSALELNSVFLDDASCATALDGCLADIFGEPGGDFPGPGEPDPAPQPPRDTAPSCGDSSANCEFSPSVDASCSTGSCDNSLSCGGCEGGSCQGCENGGCDGCDGCSGGGGGGGGGGSSGCDDGGGDGGCGGSGCEGGGCDSGGCSGGGCEGGGCDSGGCSGGSCGSGCEGGDCGGSGGGSCGSSCSVTRRRGQGQTALAVLWLLAPCVFLEYRRRRERRRGPSLDEPVDPASRQGGRH